MAIITNTQSQILSPTGLNMTSTGLSTNIIIQVNGVSVGAVQTLNITEARTNKMINEIGSAGNIDSAPSTPIKISGNCKRVRFNGMRITTAFNRGFIHLASQRKPFDILIIDTWNGENSLAIRTTIKNVWINQLQTAYAVNDFIITDDMNWDAETIYSQVGGGPVSKDGGTQKYQLQIDPIEQTADIGNMRAALDAPGLLNSFGF